jgi:hypothetical protein
MAHPTDPDFVVAVYLEGTYPYAANRDFAASEKPFDVASKRELSKRCFRSS